MSLTSDNISRTPPLPGTPLPLTPPRSSERALSPLEQQVESASSILQNLPPSSPASHLTQEVSPGSPNRVDIAVASSSTPFVPTSDTALTEISVVIDSCVKVLNPSFANNEEREAFNQFIKSIAERRLSEEEIESFCESNLGLCTYIKGLYSDDQSLVGFFRSVQANLVPNTYNKSFVSFYENLADLMKTPVWEAASSSPVDMPLMGASSSMSATLPATPRETADRLRGLINELKRLEGLESQVSNDVSLESAHTRALRSVKREIVLLFQGYFQSKGVELPIFLPRKSPLFNILKALIFNDLNIHPENQPDLERALTLGTPKDVQLPKGDYLNNIARSERALSSRGELSDEERSEMLTELEKLCQEANPDPYKILAFSTRFSVKETIEMGETTRPIETNPLPEESCKAIAMFLKQSLQEQFQVLQQHGGTVDPEELQKFQEKVEAISENLNSCSLLLPNPDIDTCGESDYRSAGISPTSDESSPLTPHADRFKYR